MTVNELKKYIYDNHKIDYVLEKLNCGHIEYHSNKDYYSASHKDGDNPMGIVIKNNIYLNYRSFSRNVSYDDNQDLISLVEYNLKCSFVDAIKFIHKILGLDYKWKREDKKKIEKVNPLYIFEKVKRKKFIDVNDIQSISEEVINDYIPMLYIGWFREGVMPWTAKKFGIAYSYKYKRVIIPMRYWLTGELLGVNSRTIVPNYEQFDIKKFYITPSYQKSLNIYGLYENIESIKQAGYVVVYEAEKSVLKRDSKNDHTGVALSGHSMSDEQARILIGLNVEIILAMDKDVPINEIRFMCEKFKNIRKVSYIYDKWDLMGEKDSPADMKNKIFNFLMKYRIKYDRKEHNEYLKSLSKKR